VDSIHGNDANDGRDDLRTRHDGFHDEKRHDGFHDGRPCLQTTNDGTNATESGIYARVKAEFAIHATNESLDKATGRAYLP